MNEEEIKKLVKEYMEDYFRMSRPGFEIASNFMTEGHGKAEFCVTTDTSQGLHFYEQGKADALKESIKQSKCRERRCKNQINSW